MPTPRISSDDSFSTEWQKLYSCAVLEVDNDKLLGEDFRSASRDL